MGDRGGERDKGGEAGQSTTLFVALTRETSISNLDGVHGGGKGKEGEEEQREDRGEQGGSEEGECEGERREEDGGEEGRGRYEAS